MFTTVRKPIKIGTSRGVILPAKELNSLNLTDDDELELIVRKKTKTVTDAQVRETAASLLERYAQDFKNLSNR